MNFYILVYIYMYIPIPHHALEINWSPAQTSKHRLHPYICMFSGWSYTNAHTNLQPLPEGLLLSGSLTTACSQLICSLILLNVVNGREFEMPTLPLYA